ncbi:hypothetical protein F5883DRAFT_649844 [Diaporthe sp. PMI_573]|nr:hypothetical protein F5883DRAFT_649844 [Diaporthaceae sp. PMI_573]
MKRPSDPIKRNRRAIASYARGAVEELSGSYRGAMVLDDVDCDVDESRRATSPGAMPFLADSAAVFLAYPPYGAAAVVASTTPVTGYLLVTANQTAIAQKATVSMMNWINMASYDVQGCANQCTNTLGCKSFDLYFQRSPTVAPSFDNSCPNPPSQCHIVCSLYNGIFTTADLTNTGEWRGQFQVVIAGSDVFNKVGV